MLLRLHFVNTNILNVFLSDLEASDLEERNLGEDELEEASQYICGKLFKELWSRSVRGRLEPVHKRATTVNVLWCVCGPS